MAPAVTSALGPESVRGLQGSGWVPTWGVEGLGEHKSVQDPGRRRGAGAAGWELPWWLRHVLWWPLGSKDSVASPGRNVGAPSVPSRPSRLPRSWWGGRGLRGAGCPWPLPTALGGCGCKCFWVSIVFLRGKKNKWIQPGRVRTKLDPQPPCATWQMHLCLLCVLLR